jgi:hypothetical protein
MIYCRKKVVLGKHPIKTNYRNSRSECPVSCTGAMRVQVSLTAPSQPPKDPPLPPGCHLSCSCLILFFLSSASHVPASCTALCMLALMAAKLKGSAAKSTAAATGDLQQGTFCRIEADKSSAWKQRGPFCLYYRSKTQRLSVFVSCCNRQLTKCIPRSTNCTPSRTILVNPVAPNVTPVAPGI